jgi:hypothetical protein
LRLVITALRVPCTPPIMQTRGQRLPRHALTWPHNPAPAARFLHPVVTQRHATGALPAPGGHATPRRRRDSYAPPSRKRSMPSTCAFTASKAVAACMHTSTFAAPGPPLLPRPARPSRPHPASAAAACAADRRRPAFARPRSRWHSNTATHPASVAPAWHTPVPAGGHARAARASRCSGPACRRARADGALPAAPMMHPPPPLRTGVMRPLQRGHAPPPHNPQIAVICERAPGEALARERPAPPRPAAWRPAPPAARAAASRRRGAAACSTGRCARRRCWCAASARPTSRRSSGACRRWAATRRAASTPRRCPTLSCAAAR